MAERICCTGFSGDAADQLWWAGCTSSLGSHPSSVGDGIDYNLSEISGEHNNAHPHHCNCYHDYRGTDVERNDQHGIDGRNHDYDQHTGGLASPPGNSSD
jgi:hypothetical protein